jgi:hypothetical protein
MISRLVTAVDDLMGAGLSKRLALIAAGELQISGVEALRAMPPASLHALLRSHPGLGALDPRSP